MRIVTILNIKKRHPKAIKTSLFLFIIFATPGKNASLDKILQDLRGNMKSAIIEKFGVNNLVTTLI